MGTATLLVAEQAGAVMGTLVRVERWIEVHGREVLRQPLHYLADVKISAEARGGEFWPLSCSKPNARSSSPDRVLVTAW